MVCCNSVKKVFGSNLRILRKSRNLTQEKLSELVGMDSQSIKFIETGRTFVSSEVIAKLSNYFNVEPEYFFKNHEYDLTVQDINIKQEINRLLSDCDEALLQTIFNVIVALKK